MNLIIGYNVEDIRGKFSRMVDKTADNDMDALNNRLADLVSKLTFIYYVKECRMFQYLLSVASSHMWPIATFKYSNNFLKYVITFDCCFHFRVVKFKNFKIRLTK